jgi:hypothetical protein
LEKSFVVSFSCSDFICAADFLNRRLVTVLRERDQWKRLAEKYADLCELDGFGDVRRADHNALTQLCKEVKELNNESAQE